MSNRHKNNSLKPSYIEILKIAKDKSKNVHFVGIGGVSMYSLARLTDSLGAVVSGSDRAENNRTVDLTMLGIDVYIGHRAENASGATLLVYSHAISDDNAELQYAKNNGIPTISRAEYLGALMLEYVGRIGVCGSHGKSTTVAILDEIFSHAGVNPTTLCGADLPSGTPIKPGSFGTMIYESCEYKDSFLRFSPTISVGLNLELDHTDYFPDIDALKSSFTKALGKAEKFSVINGDDINLRDVIRNIKCPVITFGSGENNDYRYSVTSFLDKGFEFSVSKNGEVVGNFKLNIPGVFNVHNATAAIAVSLEYGIDAETIASAIKNYNGISGRLEYVGNRYGRPVYYDYAHHPTEISSSINALKQQTEGPLTVIFKPHTYSRTKALWTDFCTSLSLADFPVITDIFPAREKAIPGINSKRLAMEIGDFAIYCRDDEVTEIIDLQTEGAIVLMGAGDFEKIKYDILNH